MDKATTDPAVLPNRLSTAPLSDDASVQFSAQRLSGLHQVTKPVIEYRITTTTFPADSLYPVLKVYPPTNSTYSRPSEPSGLKAFNITGSRAGPPLLPVTTHRADDTDTEPMPSHKALRCFAFQPARFTKGGLSYGGCHMTSPSTLETDFEETTVPSPGIELAVQTALLYDEWNVREQLARLFIPTEQRNEGRIRPQKGWRPGEREYRSAAFGVVDVAGTSVWRSSYGIWRLVDGGEDEVVDLTCHSLDGSALCRLRYGLGVGTTGNDVHNDDDDSKSEVTLVEHETVSIGVLVGTVTVCEGALPGNDVQGHGIKEALFEKMLFEGIVLAVKVHRRLKIHCTCGRCLRFY